MDIVAKIRSIQKVNLKINRKIRTHTRIIIIFIEIDVFFLLIHSEIIISH